MIIIKCCIMFVKLLDVTDSEHCSLLMMTDCLHFPPAKTGYALASISLYLATYVLNGTNTILIVHII